MRHASTLVGRLLSAALLALGILAGGPVARADDGPPAGTAGSGEDTAGPPAPAPKRPVLDEEQPPVGPFGTTGLDFKSGDGGYRLHLWFRAQVRDSYPFNSDPRGPDDFVAGAVHSLDLQRIQVKLKGNAYRPGHRHAETAGSRLGAVAAKEP